MHSLFRYAKTRKGLPGMLDGDRSSVQHIRYTKWYSLCEIYTNRGTIIREDRCASSSQFRDLDFQRNQYSRPGTRSRERAHRSHRLYRALLAIAHRKFAHGAAAARSRCDAGGHRGAWSRPECTSRANDARGGTGGTPRRRGCRHSRMRLSRPGFLRGGRPVPIFHCQTDGGGGCPAGGSKGRGARVPCRAPCDSRIRTSAAQGI
jgi:hypothetical protein